MRRRSLSERGQRKSGQNGKRRIGQTGNGLRQRLEIGSDWWRRNRRNVGRWLKVHRQAQADDELKCQFVVLSTTSSIR